MNALLRFEDAGMERRYLAAGSTRASAERGDVAGLLVCLLAAAAFFMTQLGDEGTLLMMGTASGVVALNICLLAWIRFRPHTYHRYRVTINWLHRLRWALVLANAMCSTSSADNNGFRPQSYIRAAPGSLRALLAVLAYVPVSASSNILQHPLSFQHSLVGALLLVPIYLQKGLPYVVASYTNVYQLQPYSQPMCLGISSVLTAPLTWLDPSAPFEWLCRTEHSSSMVLAMMFALGLIGALQAVYIQERSARVSWLWGPARAGLSGQLPRCCPVWVHVLSVWALALAAWVLLAVWHAAGMQRGGTCCAQCPGPA
jgi:hypothetical protein